jgi:hypothetical protein
VNAKRKDPAKGGTSEKNHPILVAVIGGIAVILAAFITVYFTVIQPKLAAGASQPIYQLKSSYSGTATSTINNVPNGFVTFTLDSEDAQGNVKLVANFMITVSGKQADYSCQGHVTIDKQIILTCTEVDAPNFIVNIHGVIFPDGHMEGTWVTTDTFDASYHHTYSWKVN